LCLMTSDDSEEVVPLQELDNGLVPTFNRSSVIVCHGRMKEQPNV